MSTAIKPAGSGKLEVAGKLTIRGATKDVVVPAMLATTGATTTATGSFNLMRNDFKIGEGEWNDSGILANEVEVCFKLVLSGVGPL